MRPNGRILSALRLALLLTVLGAGMTDVRAVSFWDYLETQVSRPVPIGKRAYVVFRLAQPGEAGKLLLNPDSGRGRLTPTSLTPSETLQHPGFYLGVIQAAASTGEPPELVYLARLGDPRVTVGEYAPWGRIDGTLVCRRNASLASRIPYVLGSDVVLFEIAADGRRTMHFRVPVPSALPATVATAAAP